MGIKLRNYQDKGLCKNNLHKTVKQRV